MTEPASASRILEAWRAADHEAAFVPSDHEWVDASESMRAFVVDLVLLRDARGVGERADAPDRDLFHACGALGHSLAARRASPTLAAGTIDRLVALIAEHAGAERAAAVAAVTVGMRAALFEGYVHTLTAAQRDDARREWDYPACALSLPVGLEVDAGLVAIAAGHPTDDPEALSSWASRVAHTLSLSGARRAVVSGSPDAKAALAEALELAGIARIDAPPPPTPPAKKSRGAGAR